MNKNVTVQFKRYYACASGVYYKDDTLSVTQAEAEQLYRGNIAKLYVSVVVPPIPKKDDAPIEQAESSESEEAAALAGLAAGASEDTGTDVGANTNAPSAGDSSNTEPGSDASGSPGE